MLFKSGVNLGGWLSQYKQYDTAHFDSFVTEKDIERIASWGMDHIRLPLDYPILELDEQPFVYSETGFAYLDNCLEWCHRRNLRLVIDLHKAPGFSFTQVLEGEAKSSVPALFVDPLLQHRFISIWETITRRYAGEGDWLAFELLNEIVLDDSSPWNALARQALAAIRSISPTRWIIVGGNRFNSASELINLDLPDDPYLLYTFHFYEPYPFTHQRAYWDPPIRTLNTTLPYPGLMPDLADFVQRHPEHANWAAIHENKHLDLALIEHHLQPALDFMQRTGRSLYCGEYGVIDQAPEESRERWYADITQLFLTHKIGRAAWSYKAMDFGLLDAAGNQVNQAIIQMASRSFA